MSEERIHQGLTRRGFLKTTAAAAGASALAGGMTSLASADPYATEGDEQIFNTICRSNCFQACLLNAHVVDGKVVKMSRGDYPDEIYSGCCLRGLCLPERIYSPTRFKTPMRRTGERGSDQWEAISWDEALTEIAQKLTDIRAKYGPRSVAFDAASGCYGALQGMTGLSYRFRNILEVTNLGICYDVAYGLGTDRVVGGTTRGYPPEAKSMLWSKHILIWGSNPVFAQMQTWRVIRRAQENGAQLTCIDPMFSATAARCDKYIHVRPGSDQLVALAMVNWVIQNDKINKPYVLKYTTAPMLLRKDNGLFLRRSDIEGGEMATVRDAASLKAQFAMDKDPGYVVDETTGELAIYTECETPMLETSLTVETIDGPVEVETVYVALRRAMAPYTLEMASAESTIPVEDIQWLAHIYAEEGPVFIYSVYAIDHYTNGHLFAQAISILCGLTDNISRMGSGVGAGSMSVAVLGLGGALNASFRSVPGHSMYGGIPQPELPNVIKTGKHRGQDWPIKALMASSSNAVSNWANQGEWFNTIMPALELIVTLDFEMTDTCRYSDYVLPVSFWLEGDDYRSNQSNPYLAYGSKAIEPLYESKLDHEIYQLILEKMGLAQDYPKRDIREWIDMSLDSERLKAANINRQTMEAQHAIRAIGTDEVPYVPGYGGTRLGTPSGRAELYCGFPTPRLDYGQDWQSYVEREHFPLWIEPFEGWYKNPLASKYPLNFGQIHERWRTHSQWFNVGTLREMDPEPLVHIAREDAESRGIKDDDIVDVFNDRGTCTIKAVIDDALPAGFIAMPKGWQRNQFIAGNMQDLTTNMVHPMAVNYVYYDCLVDVRKH